MSATATTLADTLRQRAETEAERRAFTSLVGDDEVVLTFGELHARAQTLAGRLRERLAPGERVLLLLPPGLEYVEAVFACFYASLVGVSAAPPQPKRLHRTLPRLLAIAADASVTGVVTTARIRTAAEPLLADGALSTASWIVPDGTRRAEPPAWSEASRDEVAFLQYTSGSTAQPRGVMLTHENLLANSALIAERFDAGLARSLVLWLPPYHDMGLIGGLLQGVHSGFEVVLMSPISVIKRPERWLQTISERRADASGGPNFAYDLCVARIAPEVRETLDLSCWETAFNGAEPIRATTIESFAATFGPCGFRRSSFLPCYGLAEATLLVSGHKRPDGPLLRAFDATRLEHGEAVPAEEGRSSTTLVGCGPPADDHDVAIVDPETHRRRSAGDVGEIWIAGSSVARGYWGDEHATAAHFGARIAGEDARAPEGGYLRTGDLGVFADGELFVTGRIKELLILRGRNIHPHDVEASAEAADPRVRRHCTAAFAYDESGDTRVALVMEAEGSERELARAVAAARARVAADMDVQVHWIVVVAPGEVPKTTSGKIQRTLVRELLLDGDLRPLATWRADAAG